MATISIANVQALCDSIARHIIDFAAVPGSTAALTAGDNTTLAKVAALNDQQQIYALMDAFQASCAMEQADLAALLAYTTNLDNWFPVCAALDKHTGGLPAFLATTPTFVDPHFLDAFNRAAAKAYQYPAKALAAWQAFGAGQPNLGTLAVTGATAGNFTPGITSYGNGALYIVNTGAGNTGASAAVYTITYGQYSASGVLTSNLTATATMPAASTSGTAVVLSGAANGALVTNITVATGNAGDQISVKANVLRAVTY